MCLYSLATFLIAWKWYNMEKYNLWTKLETIITLQTTDPLLFPHISERSQKNPPTTAQMIT